jgi:tetratricopeptide (TPR) repeat protein
MVMGRLVGQLRETAHKDEIAFRTAAAATAYRQGRLADADRLLRKLVAGPDAGDLPAAWLCLALVRHRLGDAAGAKQWREKAAPYLKQPRDREEGMTLFVLDREVQNLDERDRTDLARWNTAVEKVPKDVLMRAGRARFHAARGHSEQALADYNRAVELAPEDGRVLLERGRYYAQLGQMERAADDGIKATAKLPASAQLFAEYGQLCAQARRWKQAAEYYEKAAAMPDGHPQYWNFAAVARVAAGQHDEYRRICAEMLRRHGKGPPQSTFMVLQACVLAPDAVPNLAQLTRLLPANQAAAERDYISGYVLYRAGQFAEAVRLVERAERNHGAGGPLEPDQRESATPALFLAMAQHRLHNAAESSRWLQRAQHLLRTPPEAEEQWQITLGLQLLLQEAEKLIGPAAQESVR